MISLKDINHFSQPGSKADKCSNSLPTSIFCVGINSRRIEGSASNIFTREREDDSKANIQNTIKHMFFITELPIWTIPCSLPRNFRSQEPYQKLPFPENL